MEKGAKPVKYSQQFKIDVTDTYKYGFETFGKIQATNYEQDIYRLVESLETFYSIYPECRYLTTKSKMYRWIILDAHVIIYRINETEILVLRMLNSKRSISKIKASRKIQI
jgi:toxin ParE1/3/4